MTEYKRLSYQLEDAVYFGKSLPMVVLSQTLPKLSRQFSELPDISEYMPGTQREIAKIIDKFIEEQRHFIDDERELKKRFTEADKKCSLSHHLLALFERKESLSS